MPTLTQLEYIVAVDKHRHFGKAASACHVSQPTLSMQVLKVEEDCGFALFDRLKKPIVPTDMGARFLEIARSILREHSRLKSIGHAAELAGDFRLAVIPTVAPYVLPLFLDDFAGRHPRVKLMVEELKTESIVQALNEDRLDAAIMATPIRRRGIKEDPLFYEPLHLYLSHGHPLGKRSRLKAEDLDGLDLWLLQDGHCFRNQVVQFCSLPAGGRSRARSIQFEAGSLETLRNIVRNSYGYTMIPALLKNLLSAQEISDHVRNFIAPVPVREVSLVYRRDQWRTGVMAALAASVRRSVPKEMLKREDDRQIILEGC